MATPTANFAFLKPATAELFDVATYNSNLDAIDSAVNSPGPTQSKLPLGIQAINELTAVSANIPALTVLQNIASFTFKANRRYQVKWTGGITCINVASIAGLIQIQSCAVTDSASATTGLTELMGWNILPVPQNQVQRFAPEREIVYTSDTTLQIKGTFNPTGGGTWTEQAGPTFPAQLKVIDMGKAF